MKCMTLRSLVKVKMQNVYEYKKMYTAFVITRIMTWPSYICNMLHAPLLPYQLNGWSEVKIFSLMPTLCTVDRPHATSKSTPTNIYTNYINI